ncbi:MAG: glycosyltransferase [Anaerolineales bacterium]
MANAVPRVSVVMSVYNGSVYLPEAIESILNQSYGGFEFEIIDDGSTDGTWEQLKAWAARDDRIRLFRNEVNLGVASSLNVGLSHARGEYFARQDADDRSAPGRLAAQVAFLDANLRTGMLGTLPEFIDAAGAPLADPDQSIPVKNDEIQAELLDWNCLWHGSIMARRTILEDVGGYDPEFEESEDYDLWLRISERTQLANLPIPLYQYRVHPDSASSTKRYVQLYNKAKGLEGALERRYGRDAPRNLRLFLARDFLRAAFVGYVTGEVEEASECLSRARGTDGAILLNGPHVEDIIERYINMDSIYTPIEQVNSFFKDLLPKNHHLEMARRGLLSRLHMEIVFNGKGVPARTILSHMASGVYYQPHWLANRGVWSIALRSMGRGVFERVSRLRRITHEVESLVEEEA